MLVVLNALFEHLEPVERGCSGVADGGVSAQMLAADFLGCAGRVAHFDHLHVRMPVEKGTALHQGHGVGVHLREGVPVVLGQTHDAVFDVQFVFAHNGHAAFAQQVVVVQQASGNGVLNGHQSETRIVVAHFLEYLLEGVAADELHFVVAEVLVGRNVVERAADALYRNLFHSLHEKENPPP